MATATTNAGRVRRTFTATSVRSAIDVRVTWAGVPFDLIEGDLSVKL